jgi:hypothetical protein
VFEGREAARSALNQVAVGSEAKPVVHGEQSTKFGEDEAEATKAMPVALNHTVGKQRRLKGTFEQPVLPSEKKTP